MEENGDFIVLNGEDSGGSLAVYVESWLGGWPGRRRILERVRHLLEAPISEDPVPGFELAGGPAITLLEIGSAGIELAADGSFPDEVVRQMRDRESAWAADEPVAKLERLYTVLSRGHLLDQTGMRIHLGPYTDGILDEDPDILINLIGCWLAVEEGFGTDVAEIGAALLLDGADLDQAELSVRARPAIAEYWTSLGCAPTLDQVSRAMGHWLALAAASGVIPDFWATELRSPGTRWPRPVGEVARTCLTTMLRHRTVRHIPRDADFSTVGI